MPGRLWRFFCLAFLLALPTGPAQASPLFSCTLRSEYFGSIAIEEAAGHAQFRLEEPGFAPVLAHEPLSFSHTTGPRGYSLVINTVAADTAYELHYIDRPREPGADTDYASIQAWIVITPAVGEIREYDCDEIAIDVQAMLPLMQCHLANRYGARACHSLYPTSRDPGDPQFDGF